MKNNINIGLILIGLFLYSCSQKIKNISLPKEELKLQEVNEVNLKIPAIEEATSIMKNDLQNKVSPVIVGNVVTENQSSLAFLKSGTISEIYVLAGDYVKKDQLLSSLVMTQENIDLQASEIKLKQKILAVNLAKKKLDRIKEQFEAGIVNKATLETEKNTFDSVKLDLDEIKNDLEGKKYNLTMSKIYAPYEGIISQKNKSVGDFVSAGTTVFQITQNKNMEIYAQIPGIYFEKLKSGMHLTIVSSSDPNFVGEIKIRHVIPVLDKNNRMFDLYATIENFQGNLNPGDFVIIKL